MIRSDAGKVGTENATTPPPPPPLADRRTLWRWDWDELCATNSDLMPYFAASWLAWPAFLYFGPVESVRLLVQYLVIDGYNVMIWQGLSAKAWHHLATGEYFTRTLSGGAGYVLTIVCLICFAVYFCAAPYTFWRFVCVVLGIGQKVTPERLQNRINRIRQEVANQTAIVAKLDAKGIPDPTGSEPGIRPRLHLQYLNSKLYRALRDLHGPEFGSAPPGEEWELTRWLEEGGDVPAYFKNLSLGS
jgi:hypothetical protein